MELLTWHDFITQNKAFNLVVDAAREIFVAFHLANSGSPEEETLCDGFIMQNFMQSEIYRIFIPLSILAF